MGIRVFCAWLSFPSRRQIGLRFFLADTFLLNWISTATVGATSIIFIFLFTPWCTWRCFLDMLLIFNESEWGGPPCWAIISLWLSRALCSMKRRCVKAGILLISFLPLDMIGFTSTKIGRDKVKILMNRISSGFWANWINSWTFVLNAGGASVHFVRNMLVAIGSDWKIVGISEDNDYWRGTFNTCVVTVDANQQGM